LSSRDHLRSGLVPRPPDPAGPLPSLLAHVTPWQRCADPLAASLAAARQRRSPARDELPCPTIEPAGPSRHAEAAADQPRPGMPPESDCRSTHPYGADQARWTPAAAGSKSHETAAASRRLLPTRQATPGRASPRGELVLTQPGPRTSSSPVVPLACHSQRSWLVPSGQSRTTPQQPRPAPFSAVAADGPAQSGLQAGGQ
jgi:hypothetical protein